TNFACKGALYEPIIPTIKATASTPRGESLPLLCSAPLPVLHPPSIQHKIIMTIIFSLMGMSVLLALAYLLSEQRHLINGKTVLRALFLQVGFAALVLYLPWGQMALGALSQGVASLLGFANIGITFLFGDLAN